MTNEEFRSDPELVKQAREMMAGPLFQGILEVMREEEPVRFAPSPDVTPHAAHIMLGQQTGWAQYERRLLSLGTRLPNPQTTPPAEYRPDTEES